MIMRLLTVFCVLILAKSEVTGQVANDNCNNAFFIHLPSTGSSCINSSNLGATADGFSNFCDLAATPPLPVGGNEVWFTYIATGDSNSIEVIPVPGANALVDPSVTVITGNCGALATLICDNPFPGTAAFTIAAGTQVWFYVTALTTDGDFDVCVTSANPVLQPGNQCANATRLCDKLKFTSSATIASAVNPVPSCFPSAPVYALWYQFTVGTSGTVEFTGTPNGPQGYRWALWDITSGCAAASIVSCNAVYAGGQQFGMSGAVSGCLANSFCPPALVTAGNTYALMVDDSSQSMLGFDITWGGTFEMVPTSNFTLSNQSICGYDSVLLTYTGNAAATASYNWNYAGASVTAFANDSAYLAFNAPGNYAVSLQVTEGACTSVINSEQITVNPVPTANAGSDLLFCSATGQYTMGTPAVAGYIYNWSPALNINYPDSAQTLVYGVNLNTADSIVTYTLTTTLGFCIDSNTVDVTILPRQSPLFFPPASQCLADNDFSFNTYFDTVPNSTFLWTFQNGTPLSSTTAWPTGIHFTATGQQNVQVITQSPGCPADSSTEVITINPNPQVSFYSPVVNGCPPLTVHLINTSPALPGGTFLWNLGNGDTDTSSTGTADVTYHLSGTYYPTLTLTSIDNCSTTDTINIPIEVFPLPIAAFTASPPVADDLNPNILFTNSEPLGLCYYTFGDGDSSTDCEVLHTYPDTGSYLVQLVVTNTYGCIDTSYQVVQVKKFFTLYIPTAFSPNNDGRNDAFFVQGDGLEDYNLKIFNRRGQVVFKTDSYFARWNGTHLDTGNEVPAGIYYYTIRVLDSNRKKHSYTGMVAVVR